MGSEDVDEFELIDQKSRHQINDVKEQQQSGNTESLWWLGEWNCDSRGQDVRKAGLDQRSHAGHDGHDQEII